MNRLPYRRVPQSYAELCALPPPRPTTLVEVLEDDPRLKLKAGDQFKVYPYVMDPSDKWSVDAAFNDGRGGFNLYRCRVKVVRQLA